MLGGIAKAGLVYVGLNFRLGPSELEQVFENAEPELVLTDAEHLDSVVSIAGNSGIEVVDIDGDAWSVEGRSRLGRRTLPRCTTSGMTTTSASCTRAGQPGRPKGVLFDHGAGTTACDRCLSRVRDRPLEQGT